ncbi:hypothetical protein AJ78_01457 [Emergomyces pasteurianus Ep9510]|uniref:DNA replication factor Cdt1 C-terminal domain-containing protein n=1 Tax=Emergomyces pasteurianus Ep9510 TaxID=1447872 RepID=A0A1J9QTD7_9EURO|nr:hypothetical protein AJ78_01457 [Emergomyces pasteurianus Ep9510]
MGAKLQRSRPSRAQTRRLPPQQSAIQAFAKASKSGVGAGRSDSKDALSSKKRKLDDIQAEIISSCSGNEQENSCDEAIARASKVTRQSRPSSLLSSPHSSSSLRITTRSTPSLTSTNGLTSPGTPSSPIDNNTSTLSTQILCDTKIDTDEISDDTDDRPQFFHNLIALHSSFLTALSLHYAHNGRNTPADLNQLLPCTEKIWKKRKVEKQDLQRLLYILGSGPEISTTGTSFRIAQYGVGKICLELLATNTPNNGFGPPFDEAELNDKFTRNLERIWRERLESSDQQQSDIVFLRAIPLAPIHDSTTSLSSLRIGQQRLLDFKREVVALKAAADNSETGKHGDAAAACARSSGGSGTVGRRNGLLQRIQNKQLKQTTLAPPQSKEAIIRRSAVDLIEEVVGVLILLRPSPYPSTSSSLTSTGLRSSSRTEVATLSYKKPYRWNTIIQHIQDSLRCPISKQEAEACLDLLAQPSVAGEWITIVTVNRIKSVVLRSGCDISPCEIGVRVAHLKH